MLDTIRFQLFLATFSGWVCRRQTEVWTARGLARHLTLFVIDVATRCVHIAGTTTNPTSAWMERVARNRTDRESGFLLGERYLIIDRDSIFSPRLKAIMQDSDVEILLTSYQAET